jgi:23S rRNA (cytidine1920-2'-O)/16S rRNA (cytidine1409-2'-O)-methyltransferase
MPRLDVWLVESGQFSSRQTAKRAIKEGNIIVDGYPCKPSKQITGKESIQILIDHTNAPKGYHKIKMIDDILEGNLVVQPCNALDIGSSAGGFLAYLGHKGARVIGIEVSTRFIKELQLLVDSNPSLSIVYADAFKIEPSSIADEASLDLLLIDVTTDPAGTHNLISMYSPLLKKNGRLVAAFKIENRSSDILQVIKLVQKKGFENVKDIRLDDACQEVHIIGYRA